MPQDQLVILVPQEQDLLETAGAIGLTGATGTGATGAGLYRQQQVLLDLQEILVLLDLQVILVLQELMVLQV